MKDFARPGSGSSRPAPPPSRPVVEKGGDGRPAAGAWLRPVLLEAAVRAGLAALRIRRRGGIDVQDKADGSPVTEGDLAANAEITSVLGNALPRIQIRSEEAEPPTLARGETHFLVDPVDGTRDYLAGGSEFTVNIALIVDETPCAGVLLAPARRAGFLATGDGCTLRIDFHDDLTVAGWRRLATAPDAEARRTAFVSRRQLNRSTRDWLQHKGLDRVIRCSSSWKFGLLAEGQAAAYPRITWIHDWDIAAGHAILAAAGGRVLLPDHSGPVAYPAGDGMVDGFVAYAPGCVPAATTAAASLPLETRQHER